MALEDWLESEVAVAVAATTVVLSPKARRVVRRGAVYAVAGALKASEEAGVDEARPSRDEQSAEERAEELVERVSAQVVQFTRRVVVRAREELEDIVAEAQSLRRGNRPPE